MGSNITAVFTSCDRHDLLKQTLDSFIRVNCGGLKPDRTIIIEDGPTPMPDWLRSEIHYYSANVGKVDWIQNERRRGQIYSIDRAYGLVKTDYIFHCEDDWTFNQGNFMVESKGILDRYADVFQVSLRGNSGWHELIDSPKHEGFKIAMPYWKGGWGGISFNPGLRRTDDWRRRFGPYGKHTTYGSMGLGHELSLSKLLLDQGFRIADLGRRIVEHTGGARSRMKDAPAQMPKILIAIPVCHRFEYGKWESSASPLFNSSDAYRGEAYGTDIHFSGRDNDRISALRDTWLRDVDPFKAHVDVRLFYGAGGNREPLADEVFLQVPDDYAHLPHKTIAICKWASERDYDFLFKCDDDSYVFVAKLVQEALSGDFDYGGYSNGKVATGGPGYWLSSRAFGIIASKASGNDHWAEDVTVSRCLFHHSIPLQHLSTHYSGRAEHWFDISTVPGDAVCIHALKPESMRELHARLNGA